MALYRRALTFYVWTIYSYLLLISCIHASVCPICRCLVEAIEAISDALQMKKVGVLELAGSYFKGICLVHVPYLHLFPTQTCLIFRRSQILAHPWL